MVDKSVMSTLQVMGSYRGGQSST